MSTLSKRVRSISEQVTRQKAYPIMEAVTLLKKLSTIKFIESVETSVNLNVDVRKSDQAVRGSVVLPKGTGRVRRIAVFTEGIQAAEAARAAGADKVGYEDLAAEIRLHQFDFDILIATPDAMRLVGQLGPLLGPRGLMPNPKLGTVTTDVAQAVQNAKMGQVNYRADKGGIIHSLIGKLDFTEADLKENLEALLSALRKDKPASTKGGVYFKKISLSSTMGPGLWIDPSSLTMPL